MRAGLIAFIVGGFLIGALSGAAILLLTSPHGGQPVQSSGTPLVGGPFSLVGADGKTVTDADFHGRYMLVFFGFTHCPDICPTTLGEVTAWQEDLAQDGQELRTLFITVDPERDTREILGEYVSWAPGVTGITGDPAEVDKAVAAFRAFAICAIREAIVFSAAHCISGS